VRDPEASEPSLRPRYPNLELPPLEVPRWYVGIAYLLLAMLAYPFLPMIVPIVTRDRMKRLETKRLGYRP
jgi:hypothetical protein